jgi:hypothetical protein
MKRLRREFYFLLCLMSVMHFSWAVEPDPCNNKIPQTCEIGRICRCTILPHDEAVFLNYMMLGLHPSHLYQCVFSSVPSELSFMLNNSKFPEGASTQCQGACTDFPVTLTIDTTQMHRPYGTAALEYFGNTNMNSVVLNTQCNLLANK